MYYTVFIENMNHCIRIFSKSNEEIIRCIYFVKMNGNVYMTALDGHVMCLYKLHENPQESYVKTDINEQETFNIPFYYDSNFESYLKASKKNAVVMFNSDNKTLEFNIGNNVVSINEYTNRYENVIDVPNIINRAIPIITNNKFNITPYISKITHETLDKVFPNKKGMLTFYGDVEKPNELMIARWSENTNYCSLVMPMLADDDEQNKNNINSIKNFFSL